MSYHYETQEDRKEIRSSLEYLSWRIKVLSIGYCEVCRSESYLQGHHIKAFLSYPEGRFEVENGACLCEDCHTAFHSKYGSWGFEPEDLRFFVEGTGSPLESRLAVPYKKRVEIRRQKDQENIKRRRRILRQVSFNKKMSQKAFDRILTRRQLRIEAEKERLIKEYELAKERYDISLYGSLSTVLMQSITIATVLLVLRTMYVEGAEWYAYLIFAIPPIWIFFVIPSLLVYSILDRSPKEPKFKEDIGFGSPFTPKKPTNEEVGKELARMQTEYLQHNSQHTELGGFWYELVGKTTGTYILID